MQDNLQDLLHHQDGDPVQSNLRHELQHGPPDGLQAGESLFKTDILVLIYYYFVKDCKTIPDVECRIVNIDKHGKYTPKVRLNLHSNLNNTIRYIFRKSVQMFQHKSAFQSPSRWRQRSVSIFRPRAVRTFP